MALDVSADGSVIVGEGVPDLGEEGFVWDPENGTRSAKAVLETDYCLDVSDWAYLQPTGVSADGLTLAGYGGSRNGGRTEAWIARITPLSQADRDGDGTPNCADGCPDDPNKIEPGVCGCNVPDEDADTDGVLDCLDNCPNHSNASQADCDGDGTGDVCAIEADLSPDCNSNAVPDGCDIDDGTNLDRNDNSVPDECDPDCNGNNRPDDIDIAEGTSLDCNGNTLPDECETSDGTTPDCNGNRVPDECEIAAIHNCCEIGHGSGCNDPEIEACVCGLDSFCCETAWDRTCVDRMTDDACGNCEMVSDCNSNAVPDECEPDCNENDVADECDITTSLSRDCQRNGVPDECEADFDEDGTIDDCDADIDDDGLPNESDVCRFTPLGNPINEQGRSIGDLDGDCLATLSDFPFFAICLSLSGPRQPPGFQDCIDVFDFDADGDVDLRDFAGFVAAVVARR